MFCEGAISRLQTPATRARPRAFSFQSLSITRLQELSKTESFCFREIIELPRCCRYLSAALGATFGNLFRVRKQEARKDQLERQSISLNWKRKSVGRLPPRKEECL